MLQDNEKKGSRQAMKEDIITKILDRNNLNEAFKNVKANNSKKKFKRTLKRLTNRSKSISLDKRFEELNWATRGWVNYFKQED